MSKLRKAINVSISTLCLVFAAVSFSIGGMELLNGNGYQTVTAFAIGMLYLACHVGYETEENLYGLYQFLDEVEK